MRKNLHSKARISQLFTNLRLRPSKTRTWHLFSHILAKLTPLSHLHPLPGLAILTPGELGHIGEAHHEKIHRIEGSAISDT